MERATPGYWSKDNPMKTKKQAIDPPGYFI
jgi:hypothetical protein